MYNSLKFETRSLIIYYLKNLKNYFFENFRITEKFSEIRFCKKKNINLQFFFPGIRGFPAPKPPINDAVHC